MTETQQTINTWIEATFGGAGSNMSVAVRMQREVSELLTKLASDDNHAEAADECADVQILLARLAGRLGFDLSEAVDRKMQVNRSRSWVQRDGHWQHNECA